MAKQPLAEIFGYKYGAASESILKSINRRLCPFNNRVPNCTKDKAKNPLGVCSVYENGIPVITCPIRFREGWQIVEDAADVFFEKDAKWTSLTEIRLNDRNGRSAGNIDVVLVSYDENGKITDFGALEVQAVYISGNVRNPFDMYVQNPEKYIDRYDHNDWDGEYFPRPDYLSSSRKRLAPQLLYKGGILNHWNKKMAVAIDISFYDSLPELPQIEPDKADLVWLVYQLVDSENGSQYELNKVDVIYTSYQTVLKTVTQSKPGLMSDFIHSLQDKLDNQLQESIPPVAPLLGEDPGAEI